MGELFGIIMGPILLCIAIVLLARKKRFNPEQNLTECIEECLIATQDVDFAKRLSEHVEKRLVAIRDVDFTDELVERPMIWLDACRRLAKHGQNPALVYLSKFTEAEEARLLLAEHTKDPDLVYLREVIEAQAEDMFRTAHDKLVEVLKTAELNLELARSFFPSNDDDKED